MLTARVLFDGADGDGDGDTVLVDDDRGLTDFTLITRRQEQLLLSTLNGDARQQQTVPWPRAMGTPVCCRVARSGRVLVAPHHDQAVVHFHSPLAPSFRCFPRATQPVRVLGAHWLPATDNDVALVVSLSGVELVHVSSDVKCVYRSPLVDVHWYKYSPHERVVLCCHGQQATQMTVFQVRAGSVEKWPSVDIGGDSVTRRLKITSAEVHLIRAYSQVYCLKLTNTNDGVVMTGYLLKSNSMMKMPWSLELPRCSVDRRCFIVTIDELVLVNFPTTRQSFVVDMRHSEPTICFHGSLLPPIELPSGAERSIERVDFYDLSCSNVPGVDSVLITPSGLLIQLSLHLTQRPPLTHSELAIFLLRRDAGALFLQALSDCFSSRDPGFDKVFQEWIAVLASTEQRTEPTSPTSKYYWGVRSPNTFTGAASTSVQALTNILQPPSTPFFSPPSFNGIFTTLVQLTHSSHVDYVIWVFMEFKRLITENPVISTADQRRLDELLVEFLIAHNHLDLLHDLIRHRSTSNSLQISKLLFTLSNKPVFVQLGMDILSRLGEHDAVLTRLLAADRPLEAVRYARQHAMIKHMNPREFLLAAKRVAEQQGKQQVFIDVYRFMQQRNLLLNGGVDDDAVAVATAFSDDCDAFAEYFLHTLAITAEQQQQRVSE